MVFLFFCFYQNNAKKNGPLPPTASSSSYLIVFSDPMKLCSAIHNNITVLLSLYERNNWQHCKNLQAFTAINTLVSLFPFQRSYLAKLLVLHIELSFFDVGVHALTGSRSRATLDPQARPAATWTWTHENHFWVSGMSCSPTSTIPLTQLPLFSLPPFQSQSQRINCKDWFTSLN